MPFLNSSKRRLFGMIGFILLSTIVLFLGFHRNQWGVVREKKFKEFQLDSESLVIARMVQSRQYGLLSENGLLGWGDVDPLDLNQSDYSHQYEVYLAGGAFGSYSLYKSASGAQGLLFSIMDELSPYSPAINLRNHRLLEALLFAIAVSVFQVWIFCEFGLVTAVFSLLATVLSQWITLFGHNLFYSMWASFLPLGVLSFYLTYEQRHGRMSNIGLCCLAFVAILVKCMINGYDFIIPALSMLVVPVFYYGFRDSWHRGLFFKRLTGLGLAMLSAVGISILILAAQLRISEGNLTGGIASILSTFSRRTYADPVLYPAYAESLAANPWNVLWTYVADDTAIEVIGITFLETIILFAFVSLVFLLFTRSKPGMLTNQHKTNALIYTTWISMLSPLSWFLIFKGQAYVHIHTNYLAWHMPFTLFGYAMCAFAVREIVLGLIKPHLGHIP